MQTDQRTRATLLAVAVLAISAVALSGCAGTSKSGSRGSNTGGTGLVSGTIENSLAKTMFLGMSENLAQSGFNGKPVDSAPYYKGGECVYYRGVNQSFSNGFSATGNVWQFCFHQKKLAQMRRICPIPWKPGEFNRYKSAGYNADPADCSH